MEIKGQGNWAAIRPQLVRTELEGDKRLGNLGLGRRIPTASEDPSGAGVQDRLRARGDSVAMGRHNALSGMGVTRAVDRSLAGVGDVLQDLRGLALQASNGTLSEADRASLDTQFQAFKDELASGLQAEFGDVELFSGESLDLQVGADAGEVVSVALPDGEAQAFTDVQALSVADQASAVASLEVIDAALAEVQSAQATVGAAEGALATAAQSAVGAELSQAEAVDRIVDAVQAAESAGMAASEIMQHVVFSMQVHQGLDQSLMSKLLA